MAILPFIEEGQLYNQFKLDEPWDSPNNKKLLAKMPKVYASPGRQPKDPNSTFYQVFTGPSACSRNPMPRWASPIFPMASRTPS